MGTIQVRVTLVPINVAVSDDRDRPVADLKQEDFQVFRRRPASKDLSLFDPEFHGSLISAQPITGSRAHVLGENCATASAHVPDPHASRASSDV